jgi:hypothetical protein
MIRPIQTVSPLITLGNKDKGTWIVTIFGKIRVAIQLQPGAGSTKTSNEARKAAIPPPQKKPQPLGN